MEQSDYEYKGLIARFWDLLRGDTSQWADRAFFRDLIAQSGQPALDMGCGTGRLLIDYAAQGLDVDGVDNSPEMLALCREKAEKQGLHPGLYLQEMQHLELPRRYRTIFIPSGSIHLLTEPADTAEAMRRFYAHLEPRGTLAATFLIFWTGKETHSPEPKDWWLMVEKEIPGEGATVQRWVRNRYDLVNRIEHTEDRYDILRDGEVIASEYYSRSPSARWYTQEEAVALYRDAGFADVRLVNMDTRGPSGANDSVFSVLGTKS